MLILNVCEDTRSIFLLKIIWKLVIDTRIKAAEEFHVALHGFCAVIGAGGGILELKLAQELARV